MGCNDIAICFFFLYSPGEKKTIFTQRSHALTLIPKCSVTPRPCSPSTPNDRLSSKNILTLYLYFNFTCRCIRFASDNTIYDYQLLRLPTAKIQAQIMLFLLLEINFTVILNLYAF